MSKAPFRTFLVVGTVSSLTPVEDAVRLVNRRMDEAHGRRSSIDSIAANRIRDMLRKDPEDNEPDQFSDEAMLELCLS